MRTIKALSTVALFLSLTACTSMTDGGTTATGRITDADNAGIAATANEGEIAQGNAAVARATSPEVRAFAQMMVTDHTAALNEGRALFQRNNITPAQNEITAMLRDTSARTVTNLNTYSGAEFDRTYIQSQIDVHTWLLTNLDALMIPSASNGDLRRFLQTQRSSVAAHLEHARRIQQTLR